MTQTGAQCMGFNIQFTRPQSKRLSFSLKGVHHIVSPVIRLLSLCRPTTIFRRVIPVVVNSVERVFWRGTCAHIGVKIYKGFSPTVANGNSSASIQTISLVGNPITAPKHSTPSGMFLCITHAVLGTAFIPRQVLAVGLPLQTTTTLRMFADQPLSGGNFPITTRALTQPFTAAGGGFAQVTQNGQATKLPTSQINEIVSLWQWLKNGILSVSHSVFSFVENGLVRAGERLNLSRRPVLILA